MDTQKCLPQGNLTNPLNTTNLQLQDKDNLNLLALGMSKRDEMARMGNVEYHTALGRNVMNKYDIEDFVSVKLQ